MRNLLSALLLFLCALTVSAAPTAESAAKMYDQKNYTGAAEQYEQLIAADKNLAENDPQYAASLHYDLAACNYRLKQYAKAVYHYQQALRLNPSDEDASIGLQLSQSKLTDQFNEPSEMFFTMVFRSVQHCLSATGWGWCAIVLIIVCFACTIGFRLAPTVLAKKLSFAGGVAMLVLSLTCLLMAYTEHNSAFPDEQGVILSGTVNTYSSPTLTGKVQRELHEGVLITITDHQTGGWIEATLPDGSTCWMQPKKNEVKLLK